MGEERKKSGKGGVKFRQLQLVIIQIRVRLLEKDFNYIIFI